MFVNEQFREDLLVGFIVSLFKRKSLSLQILLITTAILVVPVLVMLYDLFFAAKEEEILFSAREERLSIVTQGLVQEITSTLNERKVEFDHMRGEDKAALLQKIFEETAGPLAANNPGVRLGLYLPENEEIFIVGYLHNYRNFSPEEENERERRVLAEARTGIMAVVASKAPLSRLTATYDDQVFENLSPLLVDDKLAGVVWADERLHPIFAQSRNFRALIRYAALLAFFLGAAGALLVIHNLAGGVRQIKDGLMGLGNDIHKLLPPLPGEMGQVAQAINRMALSLAEKEKLEDELHRSERLAALGRLVTGLAHELRNPIGVIKATVQVIEKEYEKITGLPDYARVIKEQADRQNRVIQELLDFGRPRPPLIQLIPVNSLLSSTFTLTEPLLKQHKVELLLEPAEALPPVEVDGERIKQVFVNLIMNAVEAMPEGGRLTVGARMECDRVVVEFTDTGKGIAREDLPHVFDPFYTTKDGGTGLGLSISHQIIKMHGGSMDVKSDCTQGTTFTINLPAWRQEDDSKDTGN
ncbi:MAG: two-component sensor histidine kinase [Peptococcaceae bacterium]|jgi:signal transduction histidine kinase|nr:MAG: two-component sensor histidine kinase [Peptococcaceae bacterium]